MIINWGRGKFADAINPKFLTPVPVVAATYINRYQYRPDVKFEFRHITPVEVPAEEKAPGIGGGAAEIRRRKDLIDEENAIILAVIKVFLEKEG